MSLRTRLVLVVATAVAAAVVLASALVYYLIRNELLNQVNRSLRTQAAQIASSPSRGLATQVPGHPKEYILHFRGLPFSNPFQFVDAAGATYRPEQGFGDVWPLLPGISSAREVRGGKRKTSSSSRTTRASTCACSCARSSRGTARSRSSRRSGHRSRAREDQALADPRRARWDRRRVGRRLPRRPRRARAGARPLGDARARRARPRSLAAHPRRGCRRALATRCDVQRDAPVARRGRTQQRRLVQDASHELRTPLTSLRTNIELLATRDKDLPPDEREHLLRDVIEQLGEMTVLIGELTELARGEEHRHAPEEVRLDLVAQDAIRRATRNHPEVPIVARARPDDGRRRPREASSGRSATCSTTPRSGPRPERRWTCV
jgi:two-component system sensor histidine kinase MprB